MDEDRLAAIVDALRTDRYGDKEAVVTALVKAYLEATLWPALGKFHGSAFNVFERVISSNFKMHCNFKI